MRLAGRNFCWMVAADARVCLGGGCMRQCFQSGDMDECFLSHKQFKLGGCKNRETESKSEPFFLSSGFSAPNFVFTVNV